MSEDKKIETEESLRKLLERVNFAPPSLANLEWRFKCREVYVPSTTDPMLDNEMVVAGWIVDAIFQRPDVETGVQELSCGWPEFIPRGEEQVKVLKRLRRFCLHALEHELDEAFHFDATGDGGPPRYRNVKLFDPHLTLSDMCIHESRRYLDSIP